MRDLNDMLRSIKLLLIGLTLISVGVVSGLLLSTTLPLGQPRTRATLASPAAVPPPVRSEAAPDRPDARRLSVPGALTTHPEDAEAPLTSPFTGLAKRVVPAVVSVESRKMMNHPHMTGPQADLFRRLFPDRGGDGNDEGDDQIEVPSSGSGFIIDDAGYIFTNDHVVSGSDKLTVHLADGRTYEAWLVGTDPGTDVAILKVDPAEGDPPLPTLPLGDSDEVGVGDWAIAIGNPLGELEGTLTVGVISAKGRKDLRIAGGGPAYQDFIQTDASINFGNSGGPLMNARGEAIGINSAINPTAQGLGFAIPINMARRVGIELIRTGTVRRGYLGIVPQEVTQDVRDAWDMPGVGGILVGSVEDGTPAKEGGLEVGDVILEFNGKTVGDVSDFREAVAEAGVGVDVPVHFLRDGKNLNIHVVLAERPDTVEPPPIHDATGEGHWLGAETKDIDSGLVDRLELSVKKGVVVTDVTSGTPADRGGLRVGDVILEVNRHDVKTRKELDRELSAAKDAGKPMVFLVRRGTTTTFVAVHLEP